MNTVTSSLRTVQALSLSAAAQNKLTSSNLFALGMFHIFRPLELDSHSFKIGRTRQQKNDNDHQYFNIYTA